MENDKKVVINADYGTGKSAAMPILKMKSAKETGKIPIKTRIVL